MAVRPPMGPRGGQAVAAPALAVSPVCLELSGADAGTASVYRCLLALPALVLLMVAVYSPRLPSHIGAVLLLLTPVGAALILVSAYATVIGRRGVPPKEVDGREPT